MANNTLLNAGSGGDSMQTIDMANFASFGYPTTTGKLPCMALYCSQAIGTIPTAVVTANPLPVAQQGALTVTLGAGAASIGTVVLGAGVASVGTVVLGAGTAAVGTVTTNADAAVGAGTAPSKVLGIAAIFNKTIPAPTDTQSLAVQADMAGNVFISTEGRKPTYSACSESFILAATPTDIAQLVASATKHVKIVRVAVTILASTAQSQVFPILLIKRSAANTGASTGMTIVPHSSDDGVAGAAANFYTANPTAGSKTGSVATTWQTTLSNPASSGANGALTRWEWVATDKDGAKPIRLKANTNEQLAVNLGGTALTGAPTAMVEFEWVEDTAP